MRAAGLDTHCDRSGAFWYDIFVSLGSLTPDAAGQVWLLLARNDSAAAMRRSAGSPSSCVKSSATEQPGTSVPALLAVLDGEKPSL